jgi:hypothetical protein
VGGGVWIAAVVVQEINTPKKHHRIAGTLLQAVVGVFTNNNYTHQISCQ